MAASATLCAACTAKTCPICANHAQTHTHTHTAVKPAVLVCTFLRVGFLNLQKPKLLLIQTKFLMKRFKDHKIVTYGDQWCTLGVH